MSAICSLSTTSDLKLCDQCEDFFHTHVVDEILATETPELQECRVKWLHDLSTSRTCAAIGCTLCTLLVQNLRSTPDLGAPLHLYNAEFEATYYEVAGRWALALQLDSSPVHPPSLNNPTDLTEVDIWLPGFAFARVSGALHLDGHVCTGHADL